MLFSIRYRKLTVILVPIGERKGDDVVSRIGNKDFIVLFGNLYSFITLSV
jgi:hypothetical protein